MVGSRGRPQRRRACVAGVAACWTVASSTALGQGVAEPYGSSALSAEQVAARRVLLDEARAASDAGDPVRALDLATRAAEMQTTPSLRRFLAEQNLAVGRCVAALGQAESCVREAENERTSRERDSTAAACRALQATARARVGYLTVHVAPDARGAVVRVNGQRLAAPLLDVPMPVDPGLVLVDATSPPSRTDSRSLRVASGERAEVTLLAAPPAPPPAVVVALPEPSRTETPPTAPQVPPPASPPPPPPPPTRLTVHVEPPTATITVDGVFAGSGRSVGPRPPGSHHIEARAEGFAPRSVDVVLREGELELIEWSLEPRPVSSRAGRPAWVVPVAVVCGLVAAGAIAGGVAGGVLAGQGPSPLVPAGGTFLGNAQEGGTP